VGGGTEGGKGRTFDQLAAVDLAGCDFYGYDVVLGGTYQRRISRSGEVWDEAVVLGLRSGA